MKQTEWITCQQAAKIIKCSARRIRARVAAGHYQHVFRVNPRLILLDKFEVFRIGKNPPGRPCKESNS